MNKNKIILLILFAFLICVSFVSALGITPGRTTLDFNPGAVENVEFKVINSDSTDVELVVLVQGDEELIKSVRLNDELISLKAGDREKASSFSVKMPSDLSPGSHIVEIVVMQLHNNWVGSSEASVGATVAVATQVVVNVPYPGKYVEAGFNIIGDGSDMTFVVPVVSKGDLDIARIGATIDIYTSLNEKIATINTNEIGLLSGERKELAAEWNAEVNPGPYRAVATIVYDEEVTNVEKEFNVGDKVLKLEGIEVNDFSLGEIAKFEMLVENMWSEPIQGAYAQMQVFNEEGAVMADFKSASYDIDPLSKKLMVAFWDTEGVRKGSYDSSLTLNYAQSSQRENFKLEVSERDINVVGVGYVISNEGGSDGGNNMISMLVIAVIVLILINLAWFIFFRRKFVKK